LPGTHFVQLPPQSTSVSVPFFTKSEQTATAHLDDVQTPLVQSEPTKQAFVSAHNAEQVDPVAATPPQSRSVSVPFFTLSGHFAATHFELVQTPDEQSVAAEQVLPVGQRPQVVDPPQSTSVSPWFFVTSEQLAIWQMLLMQTAVVQLAATLQSFPGVHRLQLPAQSTPPSVPFFTESEQLGVAQVPPVQTPLAQSPFTEHFLPLPHFVLQVPPQSTSVSSPF
jgi:hypothetical protein